MRWHLFSSIFAIIFFARLKHRTLAISLSRCPIAALQNQIRQFGNASGLQGVFILPSPNTSLSSGKLCETNLSGQLRGEGLQLSNTSMSSGQLWGEGLQL